MVKSQSRVQRCSLRRPAVVSSADLTIVVWHGNIDYASIYTGVDWGTGYGTSEPPPLAPRARPFFGSFLSRFWRGNM